MKALLIASILIAGLTGPALAQDHSGHSGHGTMMTESASTMAFQQANAQMHAGMDIAYTGDPDVDFILGMIPHHQGAVDMARVVLEHGKDPEVKALAEAIIAAQEEEIAWMKAWLAKHGH